MTNTILSVQDFKLKIGDINPILGRAEFESIWHFEKQLTWATRKIHFASHPQSGCSGDILTEDAYHLLYSNTMIDTEGNTVPNVWPCPPQQNHRPWFFQVPEQSRHSHHGNQVELHRCGVPKSPQFPCSCQTDPWTFDEMGFGTQIPHRVLPLLKTRYSTSQSHEIIAKIA